MILYTFSDRQDASAFLVDLFIREAADKIAEKKRFCAAIPGGSSPNLFFRLLSQRKEEFSGWPCVHLFWTDERLVPYHVADSNYGNSLKNGLADIPAILYPFNTNSDPLTTCTQYQQQLFSIMGESGSLDLAILGMGDDGHVASVFFTSCSVSNNTDPVYYTFHPVTQQPRVTLSLQFLSRSQKTIILVFGDKKKLMLNELMAGNDLSIPAVALSKMTENLLVITDIHD